MRPEYPSVPRGSWGHAIRAATADERVEAMGAHWIARRCGRRCQEPVVFGLTYLVRGPDGRPRRRQRFACAACAQRFTRRYHLVGPPATPRVDQALLPFGGP